MTPRKKAAPKADEQAVPESTLDRLLARVAVEDAPDQEDAATFAVDRVTRTVLVRVNPDLVNDEARHGYRLRGLLKLILSGYAAYNNDVARRYGRFDEGRVYEKAESDALMDLEPLLHGLLPFEAPDAPAPASED